jgi:RNA polymerase sigma factor (TIGR02999 family)
MPRSLRPVTGVLSSPVPRDRATLGERRNGATMVPTPGEVTLLLKTWAGGDRCVESRLFELVVPDLRRIAEYMMRKERPDHSIQPTALLNEAYCRLVKVRERDWENRQHFFRLAGRIMRHFLIDYAKRRPKGECVPIDEIGQWLCAKDEMLEQAVVISELLTQLESWRPDCCAIVELKFFVGFSDEETARVLRMSVRTMQRRFEDARRWLFEKFETRSGPESKNLSNS